MERLSDTARGYCVVKVVGAEPARFLELCANEGREFWGACPEDEFTMVISMRLAEAQELPRLAEKSCCEAEILEKRGGPEAVKRLRRRIALWILPVFFLMLLTGSYFFIWRIEITGNETVSQTEILNALEDGGVKIGSYWPAFNSEIIKSRVLAQIPELKGMSFSVFGSRVYVEVRERIKKPEIFDEKKYGHVIADQSGIIEEMRVLQGKGMFSEGATVVKGDVLISGVVEGLMQDFRLVHANGGTTARTWYEISGILPLEYTQKIYTGKTHNKYALVLGDKRINFYSNSGILGVKCDNIITEYNAGIKGLFSLPVSLIRERTEEYELLTAQYSESEAYSLLEDLLTQALSEKIGEDGVVVGAEFTMGILDGTAVGTLRAECRQNIAAEKPLTQEEIDAVEQSNKEREEQGTQ